MSRVTLRDVLRQGTLARQQVAGQMDCLRVPHLAVLERELRRLQHGKEPQLRPDTEVSHHSIQCLVEQSVFPDFRLNETREASCFVGRTIVEFVKAEGLQVHNVSDVEGGDPVLDLLETQSAAGADLEPSLCLEVVKLLKSLERYIQSLFLSHAVSEVFCSCLS